MSDSSDTHVDVSYLSSPPDRLAVMKQEVRIGLTAFHKHLPSKYFYDARGSELFEEITRLPEYYLTPAETEIIASNASRITSSVRPDEIVELGSGSSRKTVMLLEAMRTAEGRRYVPIDISEDALRSAAKELSAEYDWLDIEALVGDYVADFYKVRRRGRRLIIFLGSTIGNYTPTLRHSLFRSIASSLEGGDHFLLGVDLVKGEPTMVAAYDDSAGVSAEFNKNILRVINRELDGDIPIEDFEHRTRFDRNSSCMSQSLRAQRRVVANIRALDLAVTFEEGEEIHTEVSCKFTKPAIMHEFEAAGMTMKEWLTDSNELFALALAAPGRAIGR